MLERGNGLREAEGEAPIFCSLRATLLQLALGLRSLSLEGSTFGVWHTGTLPTMTFEAAMGQKPFLKTPKLRSFFKTLHLVYGMVHNARKHIAFSSWLSVPVTQVPQDTASVVSLELPAGSCCVEALQTPARVVGNAVLLACLLSAASCCSDFCSRQ